MNQTAEFNHIINEVRQKLVSTLNDKRSLSPTRKFMQVWTKEIDFSLDDIAYEKFTLVRSM